MVSVGLYVRLEARQEKEAELEAMLRAARPLVEREPATTAWFGLKFGEGTFGIFDVFPDEDGRRAHLAGPVAALLATRAAELLSVPPVIEPVETLAAKVHGDADAQASSSTVAPGVQA